MGDERVTNPLAGVRAKMQRADEHAKYLRQAFDSFVMDPESDGPRGFEIKINADLGEVIGSWIGHPVPPDRWAVIIGEFFHNTRSALDHLAWQLVLRNRETPDNQIEFPIFLTDAKFQAASRKMKGVHPDVKAAIYALQPFNTRPENPEQTVLWIIHILDIINKHRLLHFADIWIITSEAHIHIPDSDPLPQSVVFLAQRKRLERGTELFHLKWDPVVINPIAMRHGHMDVNFKASIDVALAERTFIDEAGQPIGGVGIWYLMDQCLNYLNKTLLPKLVTFLR